MQSPWIFRKLQSALRKDNAMQHSVNDRVSFVVSDCFQSLVDAPPFDLIVSNPPYVSAEALDGLQREVRDHEPRGALTPGSDGLSVIRRLLQQAADFLKSEGYLLIEIGFDQAAKVEGLIDAMSGSFSRFILIYKASHELWPSKRSIQ